MKKKLLLSFVLALIGILGFATLVWAIVPGNVSNLKGIPTNTTISLTWTEGSSATDTLVRFSTTTYPATTADGTQIYLGTNNHYLHQSLTAGTTYYYSAWGKNGGDYSVTAAHLVMTTASTSEISGGDVVPTPAFPAEWNQNASGTKLAKFEPFYSLVNSFVASWGMPAGVGWLGIWLIGTVILSLIVYVKVKEIFIALAVSELLLFFGVPLVIVPAWMLVIPIVVGLGVWSIERSYQ